MSENSDNDGPSRPKRKKGTTSPETYKRNIIRESRTKGVGYFSYKGKKIESKICPQVITCKCPIKCHSKIDNEAVKNTWEHFYKLKNKNAQDVFLQALIEAKTIGRRSKSAKNVLVIVENKIKDKDENKDIETVGEILRMSTA